MLKKNYNRSHRVLLNVTTRHDRKYSLLNLLSKRQVHTRFLWRGGL